MSIKDFKKYKCDECDKSFKHNIGLKGNITAVHGRKDSFVINFEFNCDHCGKNFTKVFTLEICIQTLHE